MKKLIFPMFFLGCAFELVHGMEAPPFPGKGMQAQPSDEETQFTYGECPKVTGFLDKTFYGQAVANMPIICVDILLLNTRTNDYLVVYRKSRPAQGVYFLPGGRLCKGETFFEAVRRKCRDELGVVAEPQAVLGVNNLMFPDSEWGTAGHTPAVMMFATCDIDEESVSLDHLHAAYKWCSLFEPSNVDYNEKARRLVLKLLGYGV